MSKQADSGRKLKRGEVRLRLHVEKDLFDCLVQPTPRLATPKKPDAWLTPSQLGMWSRFTGTTVDGRASRQSVRMTDEVDVAAKLVELWPSAEVRSERIKGNLWMVEIITKPARHEP